VGNLNLWGKFVLPLARLVPLGAAAPATESPVHRAAWTPLAEQGNPVAANGLGFLCQHGTGVPQDSKRAVEWYRGAARAGSDKAGANLGWMYGSGDGVQRDLVLSYMWYDIALTTSAGGNATAQQSLDHLGKIISDSDRTKAKQLAEGCWKSGFAECGG